MAYIKGTDGAIKIFKGHYSAPQSSLPGIELMDKIK